MGLSSRNVKGGPGGPGKAPFRHIDDLVSVNVDLDPHTPLRKIVELGDAHMRQATTFNDFGRPDLALQEYIKAFTIAVDKVPRHKDYPSMKPDRGDLNRLYNALKLKITTNGAVFDKIKDDIKQDNQRSGVQPTSSNGSSAASLQGQSDVSSSTSQQTQLHVTIDPYKSQAEDEHDASNAASVTNGARAGHRQKPAIQPKPQALHGKAIKQTQKLPQEDLADRFARLRDSKKPVPASPGELSLHQSLPSLDTSMVAMPKVPQAIYNPARGTVTSEAANLPSSSPHGMFSRVNSNTTAPSAPAQMLSENAMSTRSREQFVAANTYGVSKPRKAPTRARIPTEDTITAAALASLINQSPENIDILIIDVRERESFDEGHIRSHRTICVEPEILMRENISADDIADSMVLAPATERLAIERRDKVDMVVIYDDDSTSIPTKVTGNPYEMVLYNIRQALSYYSYGRPLKDGPKLLRGGLDAWVNEFGEQSLETSDTMPGYVPNGAKISPQHNSRRRSRMKIRKLGSDEIEQFEDMIRRDGNDAFDYVKTREDFIRRYPSIPAAPESMMSSSLQKYQKSGRLLDPQEEDYLAELGPAPPRRPAPAMPRTRYSGFESTDDDDSTVGALAKMAPAAVPAGGPRYVTGLENGRNYCFANSWIQAFLVSPRVMDEFLSPDFPQNWRHHFQREPTQPQLLCKIVANTLQWMHKREFHQLKLGTLMHYFRAVHPGYVENNELYVFGDGVQHDTDEFTVFLTNQLRGETYIGDLVRQIPVPFIPAGTSGLVRDLVNLFWQLQIDSASFVSKYFNAAGFCFRTCRNCQSTFIRREPRDIIYASPLRNGQDLMSCLRDEHIDDVPFNDEDGCKLKTARASIRYSYLRFPPVLRIILRRVGFDSVAQKQTYPCAFPVTLDLAELAVDAQIRQQVSDIIGAPLNEGIAGSTQYELYAVQVHIGQTTKAGHYWTYIRQRSDAGYAGANNRCWLECNDTKITPLSPNQWAQVHRKLNRCNGSTPTQLFYRRKDVDYDNYQSEVGPELFA
ncbi:cysteine proteinase [Hypoxylon rubiginosum]|uniref:Cysteine proteinase n=1 Tax=Hypoxylon rubiginosum TaxID=110542 RepID=A0ACB9ZH64_9PEZI|nr:cysteine proteinase [Hypoxylon rubiginosum]